MSYESVFNFFIQCLDILQLINEESIAGTKPVNYEGTFNAMYMNRIHQNKTFEHFTLAVPSKQPVGYTNGKRKQFSAILGNRANCSFIQALFTTPMYMKANNT